MTWWFGQNRTRTPLFTEPSIPIRSTKPEISSCWAALPKAHGVRTPPSIAHTVLARIAIEQVGWPIILARTRSGMAVGERGRAEALRYCRDLHDRFWLARRGDVFRIAA